MSPRLEYSAFVNVRIQRVDTPDQAFLEQMTYEAYYWDSKADRPPIEEAMQDPDVRQYFEDWGRDGDVAVVATDAYSGKPMGMAWARLYPAAKPSFGFVSPDIPEGSIAVIEEARGQRVGTQLIEALFDELRRDGVESVSGAVETENPAMNLYSRLGLKPIETRDGAKIIARDIGLSDRSL